MDNNKGTSCQYCGRTFSKENKPRIMKCSHNICNDCYQLNLNLLSCLTCKLKFNKREISKFPINFLLLELINERMNNTNKDAKKDIKINDNTNYMYYCNICNIYFSTEYHNKIFVNHQLIKKINTNPIKESIEIENSSKSIIKSFESFNETFKKMNEEFRNNFLNLLKLNHNNFKNDSRLITKLKSKPFNLLKYCGIINEYERKIIEEFYTKVYNNNLYLDIITNSISFNELIEKSNNLYKQNEKEYLQSNKLLELIFNFNDIYNKKLINLEESLNNIKNKIESNQNLKEEFSEELIFKITDSIFDILTSLNYQISYYIINDTLYIFEPIEEKIHKYQLNIDCTNIRTYLVTPDFKMFVIFNDLSIYFLELTNNNFIKLQNSNFNNVNYNSLLYYDNLLYNISPISLEKLDLNEDLADNKWTILSMYNEKEENTKDDIVFNPKFICNKVGSFYIADKNNKLQNCIYEYEISKDKWSKKTFYLKEDKNLVINDPKFYDFKSLYLYGGFYLENKYNQNYYKINLRNKEAKLMFSLPLNKDGFNIVYHNVSYLNGKEYTLIIYNSINNKKNYLINVWKKGKGEDKVYTLMDNLTVEINI